MYIKRRIEVGLGGTMTERRKWKAEEKLAIIKDVKENGKDSESLKSYKTILSPIRGTNQEFENFNKTQESVKH